MNHLQAHNFSKLLRSSISALPGKRLKDVFTTSNVSAGNMSRVEWACDRASGHTADSSKVRVTFNAHDNFKYLYPTGIALDLEIQYVYYDSINTFYATLVMLMHKICP
jgi:hypothetical protein